MPYLSKITFQIGELRLWKVTALIKIFFRLRLSLELCSAFSTNGVWCHQLVFPPKHNKQSKTVEDDGGRVGCGAWEVSLKFVFIFIFIPLLRILVFEGVFMQSHSEELAFWFVRHVVWYTSKVIHLHKGGGPAKGYTHHPLNCIKMVRPLPKKKLLIRRT